MVTTPDNRGLAYVYTSRRQPKLNEPYCNPTQVGGCRTLRCYESKYAEGTRQNDPVTSG